MNIPAPTGDWDALYRYSDIYYVARWEARGTERKRFSPLSWDGAQWQHKCLIPSGERPLMGVDQIPDDVPIILVEGEKAAIAARRYAPEGWRATCWSGGGGSVSATDLSPLQARKVVYWRDNDEGGVTSARKLKELLPHAIIIDPPLDFPDKWDLADPLPDGISASWIADTILAARALPKEEKSAPAALTFDPIEWEGVTPPPREWFVKDLIPMHVPTMLSGKGGLGKSLLGIQLAHAATTRQQWIGRDVTPMRTFAVFSEDDHSELHRRLHAINEHTQQSFADLETLRLMIRDGEQSSLMDFPNPQEAGQESAFFFTLMDEIKRFEARFILLDSLYNFFHGNENNRVHVSQFVYCLRRLAKECDAALVFIAHPSKSGISTGDGYAGSTAWHDAVRARLYLTEERDEKDPVSQPELVLKTMKANYAPREGSIGLVYSNGVLVPTDASGHSVTPANPNMVEVAFLKCIRAMYAQGRDLSDSKNSPNYAPRIFMNLPAAKGFLKRDFEEAMDRLFNSGKIRKGRFMTKQRKPKDGLYEVDRPQESLISDTAE